MFLIRLPVPPVASAGVPALWPFQGASFAAVPLSQTGLDWIWIQLVTARGCAASQFYMFSVWFSTLLAVIAFRAGP